MKIRKMEKQEFKQVLDTMISGFFDDPVYEYLFPDGKKRKRFLYRFLKMRLKYSMRYGEISVTDDLKGLCIWLPPHDMMTVKDMIRFGAIGIFLMCNAKEKDKLFDMISFMSQVSDGVIEQPYWYLSPICVAKEYQRRGYGKALLEYSIEKYANRGTLFLETQSEKNRMIYEKYGFSLLKQAMILNTKIPHFMMKYGE